MNNDSVKLLEEFNRYFTSGNDVDVPARISVSRDEWRQLYKSLKEQNTKLAEVTDDQIESCALDAGFSVESTGSIWAVDGYVGTRVDPGLRKFARAILALQENNFSSVQVPMTPDEIANACNEVQAHSILSFMKGVRAAEAHHFGITAQCANTTKKEDA